MWNASSQNSEIQYNALLPPSAEEKPQCRAENCPKSVRRLGCYLIHSKSNLLEASHLQNGVISNSCLPGLKVRTVMQCHETTWHTRMPCTAKVLAWSCHAKARITGPRTLSWLVTDLYFGPQVGHLTTLDLKFPITRKVAGYRQWGSFSKTRVDQLKELIY